MREPTRQEYVQVIEALNQLRRGRQRLPLNLDQIAQLARRADILQVRRGQTIARRGDHPTTLFFVLTGQVQAIETPDQASPASDTYAPLSFVGANAMLSAKPQAATLVATQDSTLACWSTTAFIWIIASFPPMRVFLERQGQSSAEPDFREFPGQQPDERVVAIRGKHPAVLLWNELLVILLFVVIAFVLLATGLLLPCVVAMAVAVLWATVVFAEWRNDQYIVTTKRAIHVERFIFSGEVWHEAPLERVQDVTLQTASPLERLLGFQTMTIRTAGSASIRFVGVPEATLMQQALFDARAQAFHRQEADDLAAIRRRLTEVVGAAASPAGAVETRPSTAKTGERREHRTRLPAILDFFVPRVMEVDGDQITWRKHWIVAVGKTIKWWFAVLVMAATAVVVPAHFPALRDASWVALGIPLILPVILWHYADWRNDVYIVTRSRIVDLEQGPLRLHELRRESTFDAVQNITYSIPGFFHRIVNVGDVVIETAGTQDTFTFESVHRPGAVQQEVFNRWAARRDAQDRESRDAQANRMAAWMSEYHHIVRNADSSGNAPSSRSQ